MNAIAVGVTAGVSETAQQQVKSGDLVTNIIMLGILAVVILIYF